jgi:hypothetical protein
MWKRCPPALCIRTHFVGAATMRRLSCLFVATPSPTHPRHAGGVAEDLAAALQRGAGAYFREDDKLYTQACGLLQRAEAAAAAGGWLRGGLGGGLHLPMAARCSDLHTCCCISPRPWLLATMLFGCPAWLISPSLSPRHTHHS